MIKTSEFLEVLKKNKLGPFMGVPCSVFKDLLNYTLDNGGIEHYICSSEGESMGLAAGFALAGRYPVVYMQNDGFGNIVNPLTSLQLLYKLPALLLISWRGEPGIKDAPQHKEMGEKITDLLQILGIPFSILSDTDYCEEIEKAAKYIETNKIPYALIVRKDTFLKYTSPTVSTEKKFPCRYEYLDVLKQNISSEDILLGATGFTGREMNQLLPEHKGKFYMMGSMGCLPSIGLGLAKSFLQKRVIVLDGDGGTLMKLGSLSTLGYYSPENLIHICFNNNQYESTGGQETTSSTTDFCRIALACGYKSVLKIENPVEFIECLKSDNQVKKPVFLELMIQSGSPEALTRPSQTPVEMKNEFMSGL